MAATMLSVLPAAAEETQTPTADSSAQIVNDDVEVSGTNSFGRMLAAAIDDEQAEQSETAGYNVFSVEMEGNKATAEYQTLEDCTLVVAVYDEEGTSLIATGMTEVSADETVAELTVDAETMPQYFYLRAFLVDEHTLRPMSVVHESPMYTKEMQDFLAKTTDDFDEDRVLNLDEDKTTNFAVYGEGVILLDSSDGVITQNGENTYVITGASDRVKTLKNGDVFAFEGDDVTIVSVTAVSVSGDRVTVNDDAEANMEDVFEFVKIDSESDMSDAALDTTDLPDYITYTNSDSREINAVQRDINASDDEPIIIGSDNNIKLSEVGAKPFELKYNSDKDNGNGYHDSLFRAEGSLSGTGKLDLNGTIKLYVYKDKKYVEVKLNVKLELKVEAKIKGILEIPLGSFGISPVPGIYLDITPSILLTVEVSGSLSLTSDFTVGKKVGWGVDEDLSKTPKLEIDAPLKGSVSLGFALKPRLNILHKKVWNVGFDATAAIELSVKQDAQKISISDIYVKHPCSDCYAGTAKATLNLSFETELFSQDWLKLSINIVKLEYKICDFYYSADHNEWGLGHCPYKLYMTTIKPMTYPEYSQRITLKGYVRKILPNVKAEYGGKTYTSTKDGIKIMLPARENTLKLSCDGYVSRDFVFTVTEDTVEFSVPLYTQEELDKELSSFNTQKTIIGPVDLTKNKSGNVVDDPTTFEVESNRLSLGDANSACITENGDLYTWGYNYYGQLGDGTTEDKYNPTKIMSNVKSVSLGYNHSACITENGDLYTWGSNGYGRLGNGTTETKYTPTKITIPSTTLTTATQIINADTPLFSGLIPNEAYNLYALADTGAGLSNENLVYIHQAVSDESGSIDFEYGLKGTPKAATWVAVPMTRADISKANVKLDDLTYTGAEQFVEPVVTLNGEPLIFGEDYYLAGDYSATNEGEYTVTIVGMGMFKGEKNVTYKVNKSAEPEPEIIKGDINNDGKVDTKDAMLSISYAKKKSSPKDDLQFKRADVNGDSKLDSKDSMVIIRAAKTKTAIK